MATNVKYYCMAFLKDGTPSVRTFASTKSVENSDENYITDLKNKVMSMANNEEVSIVDIINSEEYNLYVNGDGTNTYIRDMETGTPKVYVPPEPTQQEKQITEINAISGSVELQAKELKDAMIIALLNNDIELQEELKQEYQELMSNTNNEMKEVVEK
ncbi:hypothetical protein [Megamonas hypermegale]|uniref:hypothetical protein n=1 Tax=Megamonas hypermegale TaxID=158847 RepID=UPI00195C9576|nr:hypothetical protein [Megamonas hypermegale]MBM6760872.1 hypothetical protein [Megamonas hypermegale]